MTLLTRYLVVEFLPPWCLGIALFTFLLLMDQIFMLAKLILSKGVGIVLIGQLLANVLPSLLTLTMPMSFLLAVLLTLGRLNEDHEVVACRASGVHPARLAGPLLVLASVASLVLMWFNGWVVPDAQHAFTRTFVRIAHAHPLLRMEERTFRQIGPYWLYATKVDQRSGRLRGLIVYRTRAEGLPTLISAQEGWLTSSDDGRYFLSLRAGEIQEADKKDPSSGSRVQFANYDLLLDAGPAEPATIGRSTPELPTPQLREEIARFRRDGLPTASLEVTLHMRTALAWACPVLVLVAGALALRARRGGKTVGFGLSLIVLFVYHMLLIAGRAMGDRGTLPPMLAVWIPNLVVGGVGAALAARVVRR